MVLKIFLLLGTSFLVISKIINHAKVPDKKDNNVSIKNNQDELINNIIHKSGLSKFLEQHTLEAIALINPFPVKEKININSKFGGIPDLPPNIAWPRTIGSDNVKANIPLHFLAQFDLKEVPPIKGIYPKSGRLLFFARIEEEMIWENNIGNNGNNVKVIIDENYAGIPTKPPPDIMPIYNYEIRGFKNFINSPLENVHSFQEWPLLAYKIKTIPNENDIYELASIHKYELPEDLDLIYKKYYEKFRANELEKAMGRKISATQDRFNFAGFINNRKDCDDHFEQYTEGNFPYCAAGEYIFLEYLKKLTLKNGVYSNEIIEKINARLNKFSALNIYNSVNQNEANELIDFLNQYIKSNDSLAKINVEYALRNCIDYLLACSANDMRLAEILPNNLIETQRANYSPISMSKAYNSEIYDFENHWHQMMGYSNSTQQVKAFDPNDTCLLHLSSMLEKMISFCDLGEIEYFISAKNLKKNNFNEVSGYTSGG